MKKLSLLVLSGLILTALVLTGLPACSMGPEAPELVAPVDGSVLTTQPFEWTEVEGASRYLFQIGADADFVSNPLLSIDLTTNTFTMRERDYDLFQTGLSYYWRVYAGDDKRLGEASQVWSFQLLGPK